ncbi:hypothetical protein BG004_002081 [Podila humilis]|nr:hypothetical protein BG004_002081 [Podila humilis]
MSPPKKQTTVPSDFFTRGKKPTTNTRIITAKKAIVPNNVTPTTQSKKQNIISNPQEEVVDEIEDFDSEDEDKEQEQEEEEEGEQEEEQEEDDLTVVRDDEIQSDDSADFGFEQDKVKKAPSLVAQKRNAGGRVVVDVEATTPLNAASSSSVSAPFSAVSRRGTRDSTRKKKMMDSPTFVDVGDIHVGFHQADLTDVEKVLRQFDLTSKYGPCTDMTRLERWERAFMLGLNPPQHIKDTLVEHSTLNTPLFQGRV